MSQTRLHPGRCPACVAAASDHVRQGVVRCTAKNCCDSSISNCLTLCRMNITNIDDPANTGAM
eukprot:408224-Prorocentrum_lima.AAC.1